MARQKSKHLGHMAKVLVATYLEIMGVAYTPTNGLIIAEGVELNCSDAEGLCHDDFSVARAALEKTLAPLGRKVPLPPRVPVTVSRRRGDDQDGTVWRENQIRRLPNPPDWVFLKFRPICKAAALKFLGHNREACRRIGMELGDLQQYTSMWLILFWGKYRLLEEVQSDNARLLRTFLAQRFAELHAQITTKPHPERYCRACKTETVEEVCCKVPTVANRLAGRPPCGGLRVQQQLALPYLADDGLAVESGRFVENPFERNRPQIRVQVMPEVRLGTLKWATILDQLNRKEKKHRMELLQDLAAQDYCQEISVSARAEIDRLARTGAPSPTAESASSAC